MRGRGTVNGMLYAGPFYHVKKAILRKVSVVAVASDATTPMKVAAAFKLYGGEEMEFQKRLEEHGIDANDLGAECAAQSTGPV